MYSTKQNALGSQFVSNEGVLVSYRASKSFTAVTGDIAILPGSASKTIKVRKVIVSLSTTGTAAFTDVQLIKRSAADTVGTSAAMTAVPLDANDAAASAAPLNYTAAPTPGAAVGNVADILVWNASTTSASTNNTAIFVFGDNDAKPVILRGVAQGLAVNLTAIATQTATVTFEWTEE